MTYGELLLEGENARIVLHEANGHPPCRAFAYGTYLLMLHGLACWLIRSRIPFAQADFRWRRTRLRRRMAHPLRADAQI